MIQQREIDQLLCDWKQQTSEPIGAYIHDLRGLREHVRQTVAALPPTCQLFFAMKANPDPQIIKTLLPLVAGFEVASLGEIETVRTIDPSVPLIFGGPGKTDAEIEGAFHHNVRRIHVESLHELHRIAQISQRLNRNIAILLRVNLRGPFPMATLQMSGSTQFGINESLIPEAMALALATPTIRLEGFHFHSISNQLDATAHLALIRYYITRAREWASQGGFPLLALNVGGGIGVNYANLDDQFAWDELCQGLTPLIAAELPDTALIFECGRYLTAACGVYVGEVIDLKHNHGKTYAVIRGGSHQFRLPVSWQHNHPFRVIAIDAWPYPWPRPEAHATQIAIVGQLCTPKDVLVKNAQVEHLRVGDLVLFQYAGAYGWTISHHDFLSHPYPAQIYLTHDGIVGYPYHQQLIAQEAD